VLAQKADAVLVKEVLDKKANTEDLLALKIKINDLINKKLDSFNEKFESSNNKIKQIIDNVSQEIIQKSNIKDVCKLLDLKANTSFVEKILNQTTQELTYKLNIIN